MADEQEMNMEAAVGEISSGLGFNDGGADDDFIADDDPDAAALDKAAGTEGAPAAAAAPASTTPGAPADGTAAPATAPKTWRPEAAAEWAKIPPTVQAEILKREDDIFRGLEGSKADADFGKNLKTAFQPYEATLKQFNVDPIRLAGNLIHAHATLALGTKEQKLALYQKLAVDYGIEVPSTNPDDEPPYTDPHVARLTDANKALQSRLDRLENTQTQASQEHAERTRAGIAQEVEQFASDPTHPYFDECSDDIAVFVKSGMKLQAAYDKAVWANPVTRAKEQTRLAEETATKAKAEAAERARKAREATGANVQSGAKSGRTATPSRGLDKIGDTMAETMREIASRTS